MANIETISNDNFFTVVVDPNGINKENELNEDLFIYVDLRALPKTRSLVQTDGSVTNEIFESKGISFIASKKQNNNNYLTTDYTNIGGSNSKEVEGFGIKNISIEYGKEFNPLIKIEFLDVRGAGLLNGYETVDENGILSNNSIFSSFFSLPYPLFKLTVKGYYGKAVSYCLHLMKWSMELDGDKGDFKIVADFQGYTFAFFNDILMRHLITVVNTDVGQEALKKQNVISVSELVSRLGKLTNIAEEFKKNNKTFEELKFINSLLLDRIEILSNSIGEVMNVANISSFGTPLPIPQLTNGTDQLFIRDVGLISEEKLETLKAIVEDLGTYVKEYNDFITTNSSKYPYGNEYKIDDFDISVPTVANIIDESTTNVIIDKVKKDGLSDNNALTTASAIKSRLNLPDNSTKKFYVIDFHKFRKEISQIKTDLIKKRNDVEKNVNEELNKDIETQLNLKLNISNVFEILLGNVEAYLNVIYDYSLAADNPLIQSQRLKAIRGGNFSTDIPVTYENRVFPFPSTYDSNTGEEIWIGDIVGDDNPYFPEIELVRKSLNSTVTSEGNYNKEKNQNDAGVSLSDVGDSWIPLFLEDKDKPYNNANTYSYIGNDIPSEYFVEIKTRLFKGYINYYYDSDTIINLAKTDASFAFYQTNEPILRNLFNNATDSTFIDNFVSTIFDPLTLASIFTSDSIYIGSSTDTKGTVLENLSLNSEFAKDSAIIGNIQNQSKRKIIKEINDELEAIKKPLEDILIVNSDKTVHRQIDKNTYLIKGDITDLIWTEEIKTNIKKFYKSETSNDLLQEKPVTFTITSKINDFSLFDGQINPVLDFAKSIDPNSKFTNIKRNKIGLDILKTTYGVSMSNLGLSSGNSNSNSILDAYYYVYASPAEKAYLFLLTTPIDNITDFYKIFTIGGMYKITKMQMAWVAGQFWRAKYIKDFGEDIFINIFKSFLDSGIDNLDANNIQLLGTMLTNLSNDTKKYLPDLSLFSKSFIDKLVRFYDNWVINAYYTTQGLPISDYTNKDKSIETVLYNFLDFYKLNSQYPNSPYFESFKYFYDLLLKEFTEPMDLHVTNVNSHTNSFVLTTVPENVQRSYATQWISTFKKLVARANGNQVKTNNLGTGTEQFYVSDKDTKLAAYKYFKNLYDKWIGGTRDGKVFNSCSGGLSNNPNTKLIDRFHFVDTTFNPIGHVAVVDPEVLRTLTTLTDQSLFNFLSKLGEASGFMNFVLPSFINYKTPKEGLEMWKPQTTIEDVNSGAAYFCVYRQHKDSKTLDIGKKSFYVNDGFDFRDSDVGNIPTGFKKRVPLNLDQVPNDKDKYNLVVFRVGYADQNQNIFKSIKMNQTEHKASMEYVKAFIENFDPKGSTKPMYKKANLYNIFSLRSYQCEVTCLGNLNVHPLNYFQLDNMPFYHGAYQIIKVSHNITPNNAETTFTGQRMPRYLHPIIQAITTFVKIPLSDSLFNEKERRKPVFRPLGANYSEAEIAPNNSGSSTNSKTYTVTDSGTATLVNTANFTGSLMNLSGLSALAQQPLNLIENATSLKRSGLWVTTYPAASPKIQISNAEYTSLINKAKQSNSPSAQTILSFQKVSKDKLGTLDAYLKGININANIVGKSRVARPNSQKKSDVDTAYGYVDVNVLPTDDNVNTPGRAEFLSKYIKGYTLPFNLRGINGNGVITNGSNIVYFHKNVGDSFVYAMKEVLDFYGIDNIRNLGIDLSAGTFSYRKARGFNYPSMHAYGVAIDLGGGQIFNAMGFKKNDALFAQSVYRPLLDILEKWGWYNQGRYANNDYMHFQAATYGNIVNL